MSRKSQQQHRNRRAKQYGFEQARYTIVHGILLCVKARSEKAAGAEDVPSQVLREAAQAILQLKNPYSESKAPCPEDPPRSKSLDEVPPPSSASPEPSASSSTSETTNP